MIELSSAFKQKVGQQETGGGKRKTVESVCEHRPAGEITVRPELIEQRVIAPVLMTMVV